MIKFVRSPAVEIDLHLVVISKRHCVAMTDAHYAIGSLNEARGPEHGVHRSKELGALVNMHCFSTSLIELPSHYSVKMGRNMVCFRDICLVLQLVRTFWGTSESEVVCI